MIEFRSSAPEHGFGQGYISPSANPSRRNRVPGIIDSRALGSIDLNNDSRVRFWYHIDDAASVSTWVSGGRASGWNDDGPNSFHLTGYDDPYGLKPYYYSSVADLNSQPALYCPGWYNSGTSETQYYCLLRDNYDVEVSNSGSGPILGWYTAFVCRFATLTGSHGKRVIAYPEIRPTSSSSNRGPLFFYSNHFEAFPSMDPLTTGVNYLISAHEQSDKYNRRFMTIRVNGQIVHSCIRPIIGDTYGGPDPQSPWSSYTPGQMIGVDWTQASYSWEQYMYWTEAILLISDHIPMQLVSKLDYYLARKYGVTWGNP